MIREMTHTDLNRVSELEKELFTLPWGIEDFKHELENNEFAHYYVLLEEDEIVGYCGFWTLYEQAQITTIGVTKSAQGKGYASQLMQVIEDCSCKEGCETLSLEVRVSNTPAQKLYEKFGYITINTRKSYYSDNHEDAFLMMKAIGGSNE
ncbi:ribosomal protein S18-alanine N-acetyltransferase [Anaerorhabdus furcosa]|uniref:[Ribosomal protein bS18]-alanine N-acetyltransferase n=1 Tax=Anaerorhabdus furcosa TaxID=118967 RepID=A0A1T4PQA9_9FIRM|nr:ribosomal protein S18-alanine N-acetyltransferase [Anaerorhabdus furcosa]SJZ93589.1 ribosomal-protein-alanine N-acetyltransferase [Anaerorhabdus furcosa]